MKGTRHAHTTHLPSLALVCDIVLDSLRYCQQNKGLEVYAYCIMTSHIHLIIGRNSEPSLESIIRDIKKYTSLQLIEAVKNNPQESRRDLRNSNQEACLYF